jgi:hypothetical protein
MLYAFSGLRCDVLILSCVLILAQREAYLNLYYEHGYKFTDFCNVICKQMPPMV